MRKKTMTDAERRFYVLFGSNVQRARLNSKLSQRDIARIVNIDCSVVARWEAGKLMMRADQVTRFAQATCTSIEELFSGTRAVAEEVRRSARPIGRLTEEITHYIMATKREKRGVARSAQETAKAHNLTAKDVANPNLVLIETDLAIDQIRSIVGDDYHVEPEIIYQLPETEHVPF